MRRNDEIAQILENIAKLLALKKGESPFRIRAYQEASRAIEAESRDIEDIYRTGKLEEIPGVGPSIAAKIREYLETRNIKYYEGLKKQVFAPAVELLEVPMIGPARARLLYEQLGISGVAGLEKAAREKKLQTLPGFGVKLEEKILREAERVAARAKRLLLGVALPASEAIIDLLKDHPAVVDMSPAGSIRRMKETIGDIDILASSNRPAEVVEAFVHLPVVREVLAKGGTRSSILTSDNLQIDIRVIKPDEYGSALQYFTGSKDHNISLREAVAAKGWKLSEYGLFDKDNRRIAGKTEEEIYHALGMDYIPPELREDQNEIKAATDRRLPKLIELKDIKGDLQVHTTWSDGYDPPEKMVEEAILRGYEYIAFTDHSQSLGIAGGMTPKKLKDQRLLIEKLNRRFKPFRVLLGAEVNIKADGSLDYPDEVLAELEVVVAGIHSAFSQTRQQMTQRIIKAMRSPYVTLLSHPTGRILFRREGYEVDLEAVFEEASKTGVALEINGQPDRLDLDGTCSREGKERGVKLSCNTDAHSARQLENMRYSVATARRGWVEAKDVLNTFSLDRLLDYIQVRRNKTG